MRDRVVGLFDGTPLERPVICDQCGGDSKFCDCLPPDTKPDKQTLVVRLEKRKNGRSVTVVKGFECRQAQIQELLVSLKNECGTGGTSDLESLEVQGDHVQKVKTFLEQKKYKLKR